MDRLAEVPERFRTQVVPPTPLPYANERERRRWMRDQKILAAQNARDEPRRNEPRMKMSRAKKLIPSARDKNRDGDSDLKQIEIVEVYVSPSCIDCPNLEKFLKQNRIRFQRYDIVKDQRAFERFDKLGAGSKLPVTKIGKKLIKGIQPDEILQAATQLKINKNKESDDGMGRL